MRANIADTLERTAQTIARRANVQLVCRGNETPRTNGNVIFLPALPEPCPKHIERVWHGVLDHETSHVLFTDFRVGKKFMKRWRPVFGERAWDLLNAAEDIRVEAAMAREYPGAGDNLRAAHAETDRRWREVLSNGGAPLWNRAVVALIYAGQGHSFTQFGDDAVLLVNEVRDLIERAASLKTTSQAAELAGKILERWQRAAFSPRPSRSQGEARGGQNAPGNPISHRADAETQENRSGSTAKPGQFEASQEEKSAQEEKTPAAEIEEVARRAFTEPVAQPQDLPTMGQALLDSIGEARSENGLVPYRVWDKSRDSIEVAPEGDSETARELLSEIRPLVSGLRSKLVMTLRAQSQRRWVSDENGCRLDRRRLHSVLLDTPVAPFSSRANSESNDVATTLLVDLSGSMRGEKIKLATQCSLLLAETLDLLSIRCEVIGFSTGGDAKSVHSQAARASRRHLSDLMGEFSRLLPLKHLVFKSFNEPHRKVRGRFSTMAALDATPLNESLRVACQRLLGEKAARRVLLVLTDGQCYTGHGCLQPTVNRHLDESVALLGRSGIETVAIGMMTSSVKRHFPHHLVVNRLQDLPAELFGTLSRLLIKRRTAA